MLIKLGKNYIDDVGREIIIEQSKAVDSYITKYISGWILINLTATTILLPYVADLIDQGRIVFNLTLFRIALVLFITSAFCAQFRWLVGATATSYLMRMNTENKSQDEMSRIEDIAELFKYLQNFLIYTSALLLPIGLTLVFIFFITNGII